VINVATVKPLDSATLAKAARETGAIVAAEEHTVVHGLGGAIASAVAQAHPVPMEFVGVQDVFGESGDAFELMEKYGLTASKVVEGARRAVKRRGR
jgi:transketolase